MTTYRESSCSSSPTTASQLQAESKSMANSPPQISPMMNHQFQLPIDSPASLGDMTSPAVSSPYPSHQLQHHQEQMQTSHTTYNDAFQNQQQQHYMSQTHQPLQIHHQHVQHSNLQQVQHAHHLHQHHNQTLHQSIQQQPTQQQPQVELNPHPIAMQTHAHIHTDVGVDAYSSGNDHLHHPQHHLLQHNQQPPQHHLHTQHHHHHSHTHANLLPQTQGQAHHHHLHHQQMLAHQTAHIPQATQHHRTVVAQSASLYHRENNVGMSAYTPHNQHTDHLHHAHQVLQAPTQHNHSHTSHINHHQPHNLRSPPMSQRQNTAYAPNEYIPMVPNEASAMSSTSSPSHQLQHQPIVGHIGSAVSPAVTSAVHYSASSKTPSQSICSDTLGATIPNSRSTSNSSASSSVTVAPTTNLSASSSPKPSHGVLASINAPLQQVCRRQSSSVMSTSSVGSSMSDYHGLATESPTMNGQAQSTQVSVTQISRSLKNSSITPPEHNPRSIGPSDVAINEAEQDSKESQLSQLHQQCAILLNEQQQQSRSALSLNSPSSSNLNNNNGTDVSNNNSGGNATTSNINSSNSGRSKRLRTSFKHHQLKEMKRWFAKNQNPDAKDLKTLSQTTGLSKRVLQVWFQNARAKFRRNNARVANQQLYEVNQQAQLLQYQQQQVQQHQQQAYQHPFH